MKRQTFLIALLILVCGLFAEERRLLTMEEAILSRELIPQNYQVKWSSDYPNEYLHTEDSITYAINIRTGKKRQVNLSVGAKQHKAHAILKDNHISK